MGTTLDSYINCSAVRLISFTMPKPKEMTEEQKKEVKEAFDLFDTDGSGELSPLLYMHVQARVGTYLQLHTVHAVPALTVIR